ncbi:MAG: site-2 protease family protein [bacterium]
MRGSIPLGRVMGIRLSIHITFVLLLAWIMWLGWGMSGWAGSLWCGALFGSLFLCVLLHELGHCVVAIRYGVKVYGITLLPIGGVASMSRIPERPSQEFFVAVAGPLVNVVIAGTLILLTGSLPDLTGLEDVPDNVGELVDHIIRANIWLVLFNMIPAFPMDGGRVLRSMLAAVLPYLTATIIAARIGQVAALVFIVKGFAFSPILPIIGVFIFWAAGTEMQSVRVRTALQGVKVVDLMRLAPVALAPDDVLARCAEIANASGQLDFAVLVEGRSVGILPYARWTAEIERRDPSTARVGAVMLRRFTVIQGETDALHLFQDQRFFRQKSFPVLDGARIAGFVRMEDLLRFVDGESAAGPGGGQPGPQGPLQGGQGLRVDLG